MFFVKCHRFGNLAWSVLMPYSKMVDRWFNTLTLHVIPMCVGLCVYRFSPHRTKTLMLVAVNHSYDS